MESNENLREQLGEAGPGVRPDRRINTERRSHARYMFTTTSEVTDIKSGTKNVARSSDVSLGGCYIDTGSPLPLGTAVRLCLKKENKIFEAQAEVTSATVGMGMGLRFTSVDPKQLQILKKWVGALSGEIIDGMEEQEEKQTPSSDQNLDDELRYVVNELVVILMRARLLGEAEGKLMLKRIFR
jgi:hypothetical protein